MKKRNLMIIACLCIGLFGACAVQENQDTLTGPEQEPAAEETVSAEEELMEQNTEDIRDFALKQSDADQLISEKLDGTGYTFEADGIKEEEENHYYLYRICKGEEELKQGLAVDDISGEVFTYDYEADSVSGYEDFELYDAQKDELVLWDGSYSMDDVSVSLLPADGASSEIHVSKGEKEIFTGMIYPDGDMAVLEEESFTVELMLDADELTVEDKKGKSGFSGNYVLE